MGLKSEEERLFRACQQGKVKAAKDIIASSPSTAQNLVNILSPDHKTLLYHSVTVGSFQLVRLLIKHGADVNKPSIVFYGKDCSSPSFETCYEPPTVTASRLGCTEILRCLLRNGGDPNGQAEIASSHQQDLRSPSEIIAGCSPNRSKRAKDVSAGSPDSRIIVSSLPEHGRNHISGVNNGNVSFIGYPGMSALHSACESCQLDNVRLLLERGANVNSVEGRRLERPLHLASRCQRELCDRQCDIVELLSQHGADVSSQNRRRHTPFHLAALYGCARKVEMLMKHGANPNSHLSAAGSNYLERGEWGGYGSAMHVAAYKDFLSLAVVLINCGADINAVNSTGMTPLHLNVVVRNRSNVAALLIFHGALLNDSSHPLHQSPSHDNEGSSLLSKCLSSPRLDCESLAILLVQAGYDLNQDPWLISEFDSYHLSQGLYDARHGGFLRIRSSITSPAVCRVTRLCKWLRLKRQSVRCLSEICRAFIRSRLATCGAGKSIVPGINELPLPGALKNFLLLKSPSGKNIEEAILNCFRELQC